MLFLFQFQLFPFLLYTKDNQVEGVWWFALVQNTGIIIIIIVHYMLAASRLWHSIVQDLGIQPIFNFSSPQFLGIQFSEVLLFLLLFYPLYSGTVLPVLSEVQSKRK